MGSFLKGFAFSFLISVTSYAQTTTGVDFSGGDWENGILGKGMWSQLQSGATWNFNRVTSPVRQGKYAARIELRYGDTAGSSGTSRVEAAHALNSSGVEIAPRDGETVFYGFSVMLDKNWVAPYGWGILTQLHTPFGPPAFTIQATDRFHIITNGGNTCTTSNFKHWEFSDNSLNRGAWVDFLYRIKWGSANNGEMQVWRRNQGETTFREVLNVSGVSNYKSCTSEHYVKHGFYRDKTTPHTNILYLDGFSWGKTRDAVMAHVFGDSTPSTIRMEAEKGQLIAPMQAFSSSLASGGQYIKTTVAEEGSATYTFRAPVSGYYSLEAVVQTISAGRNSVYVRFDNQGETIWHMKVSPDFHLEKWADCDYTATTCKPLSIYLSEGTHQLTLRGREFEAGIDSLTLRRLP